MTTKPHADPPRLLCIGGGPFRAAHAPVLRRRAEPADRHATVVPLRPDPYRRYQIVEGTRSQAPKPISGVRQSPKLQARAGEMPAEGEALQRWLLSGPVCGRSEPGISRPTRSPYPFPSKTEKLARHL